MFSFKSQGGFGVMHQNTHKPKPVVPTDQQGQDKDKERK